MELIIFFLGVAGLVLLIASVVEFFVGDGYSFPVFLISVACFLIIISTHTVWSSMTEIKYITQPLSTATVDGHVYKGYYYDGEFVFAPNPQHQYDYLVTVYPRAGSIADVTHIFIPAKDTLKYQNSK